MLERLREEIRESMPQMAAELEIGAGRHVARHFRALPDLSRSLALLDEITAAAPGLPDIPGDRPLALYGAGNLGRMARDFLKTVWLDFDFVVDRNAAALRDSPDWQGMTLYHPDEVPDALKQSHLLLVSVVLAPYVPIETELLQAGFRHVVPFYDFTENFRQIHPLANGWHAGAFSDSDKAMTKLAVESWSDDISRAHHLAFLAWRALRQEWTFETAPVTIGDRFFIPEIMFVLDDHEVFLDCGAHHGTVTRKFSDAVHGRWQRIVAIEPDEANAEVLNRSIADAWPDAAQRRPEFLATVLGAATGTTTFHDGLGYASQVSPTGHRQAEMQPIDGLGLAPTFIKLHLEGHELEALKGARQTLLKHRPIVVATVYHNDDGIWRTPLWLMKTLKDYRLLFRLHSYCGTSAVIYAIPAERER
jgi:FkbM family methyltransferase